MRQPQAAVLRSEMEVMPDHVHLLVDVDPQFGIHRLVRRLKGRSSRLLRQEFLRLRSRLPTLAPPARNHGGWVGWCSPRCGRCSRWGRPRHVSGQRRSRWRTRVREVWHDVCHRWNTASFTTGTRLDV